MDLIREAVELARRLQERATALQTPQERRQQAELDRMIHHPADKATLSFTVHAPERWEVISNGRLVGEPEAAAADALGGAEGKRTWRWERSSARRSRALPRASRAATAAAM